jgi:hypothetical protein
MEIKTGKSGIAKPLLLWINDGLMAVFFFLVGMELKREVVEGHLSSLGGRFEGHNTDFFLTPAYPSEKHVLCPRNAGIHEFPGSRRDILIRMNQHIKPAA